jgi:hypothetical protein
MSPFFLLHPHVHHILFKTGLGRKQQELVAEGIMILDRAGIDFKAAENLVWAENKAGQHTFENVEKVVEELRKLEKSGASKKQFINKLKQLGKEAAER